MSQGASENELPTGSFLTQADRSSLHLASREIEPVRFREIAIYEGHDHPHAGDRGLVMVFRTR